MKLVTYQEDSNKHTLREKKMLAALCFVVRAKVDRHKCSAAHPVKVSDLVLFFCT